MKNIWPVVKQLGEQETSELENLLEKYGLEEVASVVREARGLEVNCFIELLEQ